ncbi:MAG: hypothetical protein KF712_13915 [Akkermansiaceae bacterium]|nr:hypothetical protein [Akkermansiaceae bacterium]
MTLLKVRQFLATLLLICFGALLPTAASPMRVCFLDHEVLEPGFATYGETSTHKLKCCPDCGSPQNGDSCCMDVKKLPDAPEAVAPVGLPPVVFSETEFEVTVPPCPVVILEEAFIRSAPIRGPDSPGTRRALLGIWNI